VQQKRLDEGLPHRAVIFKPRDKVIKHLERSKEEPSWAPPCIKGILDPSAQVVDCIAAGYPHN